MPTSILSIPAHTRRIKDDTATAVASVIESDIPYASHSHGVTVQNITFITGIDFTAKTFTTQTLAVVTAVGGIE